MKLITQKVIVYGVSHPTTLQVIRSIGRKGIKVFLISIGKVNKDVLHFSCYVESYIIFDSYTEGIEFLLNSQCITTKPLILVSGDDAAIAIDSHKDELSQKYIVPGSSKYSIEYLMRKDVMNSMAANVGLNVPNSKLLHRGEECELRYPILLKPAISVEGSKNDIKICRTKEELDDYWRKTNLYNVLATEFIEKDYEVCILCAKLKDTPSVISGVVKKLRHMPLIYGARSFAIILKCESIPIIPYSKICKLIENTCFSGLLSIELLIKDNQAWFVELNYRADGNMMAYTDAGCNLPYNCYLESIGELNNVPSKTNKISKEIYIMTESDFYHVTKYHDVSFAQWISDLKKSSSFIVWDKHDLMPFIMHKYIDYKDRILRRIRR